ncbi:MAG: S9 family peptidase [Deltaproteobacteria bacterium]|nr:S9 family peptidase [Deltaproteobacteria bacterium]
MHRVFRSRARVAALALGSLVAASAHAGPTKRGLTVDDMLAMQRLSEPTASPDGAFVAFTVRETDVEANRGRTDVWVAPAAGGDARRFTTHPDNDGSPRFSPDGRFVLFLSTRSGSSQVWRMPLAGGEAEQVTKLPVDVAGFLPFPDGQRLLLAMDAYPDASTLEETVRRDEEQARSKVKAKAYDELLFRHWDSWEDGKRSHLFIWSPAAPGRPVDVLKGLDVDSPEPPFGGMEQVSVSPDGQSVVFSAKDVGRQAAWQTNADIFVVDARPTSTGKQKPVNLTTDNAGWDGAPVFSPDGKTIAFLSMARAQYESDRTRIILFDVASKERRVLTDAWDRSPGELVWARDGKTLFTSADHLGHVGLFAVDVASGKERLLVGQGTNQSPVVLGERLAFLKDTLQSPAEVYSARVDGTDVQPLTHLNDARVARLAWGAAEQFTFIGAHGDTVHGFAMKPANFEGRSKAPVAFLIHGGPQGSFGDHFHYRWNPQTFAGHGYAVVFIDFHGSTGYGQKFTDAINGDWGGAPYEDLMKGLDAALQKYSWMDGSRVAALGASYGGFMINWINGHTDRFKALVCHDGNLDERMAYFDTEELWFPEWEHGGVPWEKPAGYTKHNPIDFVQNWKTPTLVVHGALDFRVVDTQGMSTFTALRRKGVPARLLWFPDENHWVLKPQNSQRWHAEVLAWIDRYIGHTPPR